MVRRNLAALLVLGLLALGACSSPQPAPPTVDRDAYEHERRDFLNAYDELVIATRATPNWVIDAKAFARVRGQEAIVQRELAELRPFYGHRQISTATVDLLKLHVQELARTDDTPKPEFHTDRLDPRPDEAMQYAAEEQAYFDVTRRLPWLETYVADGISDPFLEQQVMINLREEARRVLGIDPETRRYWCTMLTQHSMNEFETNRGRIRSVLDGLERLRG